MKKMSCYVGVFERSSNLLQGRRRLFGLIFWRFQPDLQENRPESSEFPGNKNLSAPCGAGRAGRQVFGGAAAPPLAASLFLTLSEVGVPVFKNIECPDCVLFEIGKMDMETLHSLSINGGLVTYIH
jgi:hypothetical protein